MRGGDNSETKPRFLAFKSTYRRCYCGEEIIAKQNRAFDWFNIYSHSLTLTATYSEYFACFYCVQTPFYHLQALADICGHLCGVDISWTQSWRFELSTTENSNEEE